MYVDLKNRWAIVSGANRGIGLEICKLFIELGNTNIIALVRNENQEVLENLKLIAKKNYVSLILIEFSLDEKSIDIAVAKIKSLKLPISILINNAGVSQGSLFQLTKIETLRDLTEKNYLMQIYLTQKLARVLIKYSPSSIINMSSISSYFGSNGFLAYGSSKAALRYSTKVLASELGSNGVRVNSISPGVTLTDMANDMDENTKENFLKSTSLKRFAYPKEIAQVVLFLASEHSSYITGQDIKVDGGMTIV